MKMMVTVLYVVPMMLSLMWYTLLTVRLVRQEIRVKEKGGSYHRRSPYGTTHSHQKVRDVVRRLVMSISPVFNLLLVIFRVIPGVYNDYLSKIKYFESFSDFLNQPLVRSRQ